MKYFIQILFISLGYSTFSASNLKINSIKNQNDSVSIFRHFDKIKSLVQIWNTSINEKKLSTLNNLYADTVQYYVKKISPQACIKSKETWLTSNPNYKQKVQDLLIYYKEDVSNIITVEFEKIYTDKSTKTVTALLEFKLVNNSWKLFKETDIQSEVASVKKITPYSLQNKKYKFTREYWMDTRNTGLAHDMVPYKFYLDFKINKIITGTFSRYSGMLRSWMDYTITKGSIQNGILELNLNYQGTAPQKMRFKIINEKSIMCIDGDDELLGKILSH